MTVFILVLARFPDAATTILDEPLRLAAANSRTFATDFVGSKPLAYMLPAPVDGHHNARRL